MLNSFKSALQFIAVHGLLPDFKNRIITIYTTTQEQQWLFSEEFSKALDAID